MAFTTNFAFWKHKRLLVEDAKTIIGQKKSNDKKEPFILLFLDRLALFLAEKLEK